MLLFMKVKPKDNATFVPATTDVLHKLVRLKRFSLVIKSDWIMTNNNDKFTLTQWGRSNRSNKNKSFS